MLLSCVAFALPASALATAEYIDYKQALYFETAPTIDGYISEAEWGQHTVFVEAWDCATVDDSQPYYNFFYNRISATNRDDYENFSYYIWLRWDLNKFYIGVKVNDPDGHSLKNGTTNTWNGDAVQTRIDKNGANAAVDGGDFYVDWDMQKPWSTNSVPDFLFGYTEIAGGFSEAWENTTNKGMTSFSNNPMGVTQCVVAPAGSDYSTDTQAGITTYEVAIPWSYIYNGEYDCLEMKQYAPGRDTATRGPRGAIGKELGMSLVVLNDGADARAGWDAFMSWGSGICQAQTVEGARSCAGSNSVVLIDTPVSQASGYQTYDPTPLLDAKFTTDHLAREGVFYDYLAGDIECSTAVDYDDLDALMYNDPADLSVWGSSVYGGSVSNMGGDHGNVLDYRTPDYEYGNTYIDTRDGAIQYLFPTSYTFEFDIMYTGLEQVVEGYGSELYNWFGGPACYEYQCGYFFDDNAFKVVNTYDPDEVIASYSYDLKKDTWYNWKFQYDNDSCNARLWIDDLSTEADNAVSGTKGTPGYTGAWGTLVINANWRYFYYSTESVLEDGTLLIFRQMNTQLVYDNVKIYSFGSPRDCSHIWNSTHTVPATCTNEGKTEIICTVCSAVIQSWVIPAKGHLNTREVIVSEATCTEDGERYTICDDCGETVETVITPATGHLNTAVSYKAEPTCVKEGYTGDTICLDCGTVLEYGSVIPAAGHGDTYETENKAPTCTEEGYTGAHKCVICDEVVAAGEILPALGHSVPSGVCTVCGCEVATEGLVFETDPEAGTATVVGYTGSDTNVFIPNTYEGCRVTTIASFAFSGDTDIISVRIPESITDMEVRAFEGCYDIEGVYIDSMEAWLNINFHTDAVDKHRANPMHECKNLYLNGELVKNVVIPDGVTAIKNNTFYNVSSLESITIPDSVTTIGDKAFEGCTSLESIVIPDSVTMLGRSVFHRCSSLESIELSDNLTHIGDSSFASTAYARNEENWTDGVLLYVGEYLVNCRDFANGNVVIKEGTKVIADYAVLFCTKIESVTIPVSITNIGENAFKDCTRLSTVYYNGSEKQWNDNVVIAENNDVLLACEIIFAVEPLNGWVNEGGKWAYYENNVKLTNQWKKDSTGWCYLGADGYMLTNKWVKDSIGWCYVGSNGYMVYNKWVKDSIGWCHVGANGYMVYNKWVKDSIGWCHVGANGYMEYNKWVKDSVGWCHVGANGYMEYNKWVKDSIGWCHVGANGYMEYNKWVKDSVGWCYVGSSGYMVTNAWVSSGGQWYYMNASGYMVTGRQLIGGKYYTFNSSGVWVG